MPAPAIGMLVATALIVVALGASLLVIIALLLRISSALVTAGNLLGALPEMLEPLDPVVGRLAGALVRLRSLVDSDFVPNG
ncbi:MAG: hypothetical protein FWE35_26645 [Streptosporangiales bacterium]|nr:hypothetical protein [Streptosporangiales bacterium]